MTDQIVANVISSPPVATAGELVELTCVAQLPNGQRVTNPVTVNWLPLSSRTRLEGSTLILLNATRGQDDQFYQCLVNNAGGVSSGDNVEVLVNGR